MTTDPEVTGALRHASIDDVASRAGVSTATVSRSLRGLPGVSEATRARVLRAAAELSYVASPAAAGLASGRSRAVGLVMPYAARWFFSQVLVGTESVLRSAGYDLLVYTLRDAADRETFFAELPVRRRVDAVVVVSLTPTVAEDEALARLGLPVVVVGAPSEGHCSVRIDDGAGARRAARHLVNLGHERVAMIGDSHADGFGFSTSDDRERGFADGLGGGAVLHLARAPWGARGGASAMAELLVGDELPTAVFASTDDFAFGALRTLRRAGLAVPGVVSVVGFDDHELAETFDLTTIRQPVIDLGARGARLLADQLDGAATACTDVVLETELVVRETTAPAAGARWVATGRAGAAS